MPAVSQAQQRYMGMIHAIQKGDMEAPSKDMAEKAKEMDPTDVTHFAETSHEGLPKRLNKEAYLLGYRHKPVIS